MYSIFFWILAFLWLVGVFWPETNENKIFVGRTRGFVVLAMLILLGAKTYPFHG